MASPLDPTHGAAWVTGASSGIGRDVALQLASDGWTVAATARSEDELASLVMEAHALEGRIHAFPGDVTDHDRMTEIAREIASGVGPLALAVLNAGVYLPVDARNFSAKAFGPTFNVNLVGVANCLEPAIAAMREAGQGQIAIVASVTGYGGLPTSAAYGASKAALINLAETLRIELDPIGIHVQVINPGFIDTPATKDNPFPMPALMASDKAAKRITAGLQTDAFEITFPKRFTYVLKLIGLLPTAWRLGLVRRVTGWSDPATTPEVPTGD
ncbi:SDR family NAD(P)-dependent oxidoreductase [Pyruvatibacter mobilis]|uniref:SDR family NAD(P)-dependent oxidoreductase n=1 Tax=Pyruvatibacter mobilis TaxID=1712261 RepID=UPI003BAA05CF